MTQLTEDTPLPTKDGIYLVKVYWINPMTKRVFNHWQMMEFKSGMWTIFTGNKIEEWKEYERV